MGDRGNSGAKRWSCLDGATEPGGASAPEMKFYFRASGPMDQAESKNG
jgi:hypothetical protein